MFYAALLGGSAGYSYQNVDLGKAIDSWWEDFEARCSWWGNTIKGWFGFASSSEKSLPVEKDQSKNTPQPQEKANNDAPKHPNYDYPGNDSTKAPEGFKWRGQPDSQPGSKEGSYYNPDADESFRPALDDTDHGPHWDYQHGDERWRVYPDGTWELKQ